MQPRPPQYLIDFAPDRTDLPSDERPRTWEWVATAADLTL